MSMQRREFIKAILVGSAATVAAFVLPEQVRFDQVSAWGDCLYLVPLDLGGREVGRRVMVPRSGDFFEVTDNRVVIQQAIQFGEVSRNVTVARFGIAMTQRGPLLLVADIANPIHLMAGDHLQLQDASYFEVDI